MESTKQSHMGRWEQMIQDAVREPDPVLCNLKITRCHYLLSCALQELIGPDAGANFHSWAVWGSHKAGATIRQEELGAITVIGAIIGGLAGPLCCWFLHVPLLLGVLVGAITGWKIAVWKRGVAARLILEGNRTVLEDIGTQTGRFLDTFQAQTTVDAPRLAAFLAGLRSGDTEDGGQDLLSRAFTNYYTARFTQNLKAKQEATYLANCQAVFHEHVRLDSYIRGAIPWIVRRSVTRRLQFNIGPVQLRVAEDVSPLPGNMLPETLRTLENTELRRFLSGPCGCEIDADFSSAGGGARDWTKFGERMRYIVRLFHAFHLDPIVYQALDDTAQLARKGSRSNRRI